MFVSSTMALAKTTIIEFPGLGIEQFSIDRVAFSLFGKPIYWYGIIIMFGIIAAFVHALYRAKQEGVKSDDLMDVGLAVVVSGIIGARAYYVLTTLDQFDYSSFLKVIAIWDGGLAIYGGVIAGAAAVVVTCLIKKINSLRLLDMIAPGVMLAQAIGRWGNFCNGEAFGYEVAEGSFLYPFRMGLISHYTNTGDVMHYYHPTFLYESVWNLVGFVIITLLYRKKKFQGQILLYYLTWYGFGRFFVEGLRTDSLYIPGTSLRISQVVGIVCFVLGTAALITGLILQKKGKLPSIFAVTWAEPVPAVAESVADTTAEAPTQENEATPVADGDTAAQEEQQEENRTEENSNNGDE